MTISQSSISGTAASNKYKHPDIKKAPGNGKNRIKVYIKNVLTEGVFLYSKNGLSIDRTNNGTYTDSTWPSNLKLLYSSTVDGIRNEGWSVFVDKSAL